MSDDPAPGLGRALTAALEHVKVEPEDGSAVALARKYAAEIDEGNAAALAKLGPLLLAALVELGMTPRARAAVVKGKGDNGARKRSALDDLQDEHDARSGADAP
ncbi:terminase small subunit [Actinokineospora spheciospongiae]|uniref:terminase small subunit n=1 Tax=Actinokineospora spheciospongiae TaxID=909613 RepID=UPI000D7135A0|nr:hypothetical protein [Actinokineospora spheciospongiae]PWW50258.1 hypothetical protein DFQ13_12320 [Actinokineospora spheciospongiae]